MDDSDRDVDDLINYGFRAAQYIGRKIEAGLQRKPKPKRTLEERCGAGWLRTAEIARKASRSPDATARDLVEWEAFYIARHKSVALHGDGGRKDLKLAHRNAAALRLVRRAYETETGYCAATGNKLRPEQRRVRAAGLKPEWFDEARILAGQNSVDSRFYQAARKHMGGVKDIVADDLMPVRVKRRGAKQLTR